MHELILYFHILVLQDEVTTIAKRKEKSDLRERGHLYCQYKNYIRQHSDSWDLENR